MQANLRRLSLKGSIIILLSGCHGYGQSGIPGNPPAVFPSGLNPYPVVGAIPTPAGYHRLPAEKAPFTAWLRAIPLKKDRTVYLFDGSRKRNQDAQFAVLDVSVGYKDLQQCADAVMRLRAEFLYAQGKPDAIDFYTEQGVRLNFREWENGGRVRLSGGRLISYTIQRNDRFCDSRACFDDYLETVFSYCGTRTLERQLEPVTRFNLIQPGDVLIRGGAPGHAMLVMDVAEDAAGNRVYLLAQSYMPAQDIHLVVNPGEPAVSPWYRVGGSSEVITPEWTFYTSQLRSWPKTIGRL